jgi:hypothetical protein
MTGRDSQESDTDADDLAFDDTVERSFTCPLCGFVMVHETRPLTVAVGSVCLNCGDWTQQVADDDELLADAEALANLLAGDLLTGRQALAYLLREIVDADRQIAADAMESTPSNLDNLHRRASEKIDDARRVVDGLEALQTDDAVVVGESETAADGADGLTDS